MNGKHTLPADIERTSMAIITQELAAAGIELVSGVSGSIDEAVKAFLAGRLKDDPAAECDHHHHGEIEGSCHGCGHGEAHGCH